MLTWSVEGEESGRYASRAIHFPGGNSGVTIGRGYDMRLRSREEIELDLKAVGVGADAARAISAGAGLRGDAARRFVRERRAELPALTPEQERRLFSEVTYPRYETEARRISSKRDVVRRYGELDLEALDRSHYEVLVDLLYRGDYTPQTRISIQPALVAGDTAKLCDALEVVASSRRVPAERARARRALLGCD
jgi:hypothetical protein